MCAFSFAIDSSRNKKHECEYGGLHAQHFAPEGSHQNREGQVLARTRTVVRYRSSCGFFVCHEREKDVEKEGERERKREKYVHTHLQCTSLHCDLPGLYSHQTEKARWCTCTPLRDFCGLCLGAVHKLRHARPAIFRPTFTTHTHTPSTVVTQKSCFFQGIMARVTLQKRQNLPTHPRATLSRVTEFMNGPLHVRFDRFV